MAELVECARLEIVYTGNCIEGSNPPISAIKIKLPFWQFYFYLEILSGLGATTKLLGSWRSRKGPTNAMSGNYNPPISARI